MRTIRKKKQLTVSNAGEDTEGVEEVEFSYIACSNIKRDNYLVKSVLQFFRDKHIPIV